MKTSKTGDVERGTRRDHDQRSQRWWGLHWHSPFVFPGSSLLRMTGVVRWGTHVTVVHGRQDGSNFHVDHAETFSGPDAIEHAAERCRRFDAPVCAAVPRGLLLDRHYRIPAKDDAEVESMLGHLLAQDLPLPIEEYAWTWARVRGGDGPLHLVKVFVARNDHLDAFAEPLTTTGLPVVDLIPTGWALARVVDHAGGPGSEEDEPVDSTFVVPGEGAACLVVARDGELLFDAPLPEAAAADVAADPVLLDAETWKACDAGYREVFSRPLPAARVWRPKDDRDAERSRTLLAAAVATLGLERHRSLMPPERDGANRRRLLIRGMTDVLQILFVTLLLFLAVFVHEDQRRRDRLGAIEHELAGHATQVAAIRRESEAVRAFDARDGHDGHALAVIRSLRRNVPAPVALDHLEVDATDVVRLRGVAPATTPVLAMADALSEEPLWDAVRVVQLRAAPEGTSPSVRFQLEGRIREGSTP